MASKVIDSVFYPAVEKQLEHLNEHLQAKYGVRVGIEINWFFEKVDD